MASSRRATRGHTPGDGVVVWISRAESIMSPHRPALDDGTAIPDGPTRRSADDVRVLLERMEAVAEFSA